MASKQSPAPYGEDQVALAPPWLQKPVGEAFISAQGVLKDAFIDGAIRSIQARFVTRAPEDALPVKGYERSLERYPTESATQYRNRLQNAWAIWANAGTAIGIVNALNGLGLTSVKIYENSAWSQPPSPGYAPGAEWWRFWVVITPPHPFGTPRTMGDGARYGGGQVYGASAPAGLLDAIRGSVRKWKPAHAICVNVIIVLSGRLYGDGGTYGSGLTYGSKAINVVP